jgi:hypothetical protein
VARPARAPAAIGLAGGFDPAGQVGKDRSSQTINGLSRPDGALKCGTRFSGHPIRYLVARSSRKRRRFIALRI